MQLEQSEPGGEQEQGLEGLGEDFGLPPRPISTITEITYRLIISLCGSVTLVVLPTVPHNPNFLTENYGAILLGIENGGSERSRE